jgi:hypothetical protein
MYRCYLIRNGRIAWGEYIDFPTTEEAKLGARALWKSHPEGNSFTGIEVWKGATLVYGDEDHADQAGTPEPIASPFETAESTIYATWRPTEARPIGMSDNGTRLSASRTTPGPKPACRCAQRSP